MKFILNVGCMWHVKTAEACLDRASIPPCTHILHVWRHVLSKQLHGLVCVQGSPGSMRRQLRLLAHALQGKGPGGDGSSAKNPLIGDVFVIAAQLAAATQFIIEEKYLTAYRVPALLAVGLEGTWGLIISACALPACSFIRWPDGTPIDVLPAAIRVWHCCTTVLCCDGSPAHCACCDSCHAMHLSSHCMQSAAYASCLSPVQARTHDT